MADATTPSLPAPDWGRDALLDEIAWRLDSRAEGAGLLDRGRALVIARGDVPFEAMVQPDQEGVPVPDPARFIPIERSPYSAGVALRQAFLRAHETELGERLQRALDGPTPYLSFDNALDGHPAGLARWRKFHHQALRDAATTWLQQQGLPVPGTSPAASVVRATPPPRPLRRHFAGTQVTGTLLPLGMALASDWPTWHLLALYGLEAVAAIVFAVARDRIQCSAANPWRRAATRHVSVIVFVGLFFAWMLGGIVIEAVSSYEPGAIAMGLRELCRNGSFLLAAGLALWFQSLGFLLLRGRLRRDLDYFPSRCLFEVVALVLSCFAMMVVGGTVLHLSGSPKSALVVLAVVKLIADTWIRANTDPPETMPPRRARGERFTIRSIGGSRHDV